MIRGIYSTAAGVLVIYTCTDNAVIASRHREGPSKCLFYFPSFDYALHCCTLIFCAHHRKLTLFRKLGRSRRFVIAQLGLFASDWAN